MMTTHLYQHKYPRLALSEVRFGRYDQSLNIARCQLPVSDLDIWVLVKFQAIQGNPGVIPNIGQATREF